MSNILNILEKEDFTRENLVKLLEANTEESQVIFEYAHEVKKKYVGNFTYFRGLLEYSNYCSKDCYYCGIRSSNSNVARFVMTDEEVLQQVKYAIDHDFASIVIQCGEKFNQTFTDKITYLLEQIKKMHNGSLGITLSMGEQKPETLKRWYEAGANRYLLRIESSTKSLYLKIHPKNKLHDYKVRLNTLKTLQEIGYQTGTGVMIGLPFQTTTHLADDLLFIKNQDIDMVGMGPYIEHQDTPLYKYRDLLISKSERMSLSLKMVAILRIMMKDINIAATTAMQTLSEKGREKAIRVGSNVVMPNLTPLKYRRKYLLYEDKPIQSEKEADFHKGLIDEIIRAGDKVGYGSLGTSKHFLKRKANT